MNLAGETLALARDPGITAERTELLLRRLQLVEQHLPTRACALDAGDPQSDGDAEAEGDRLDQDGLPEVAVREHLAGTHAEGNADVGDHRAAKAVRHRPDEGEDDHLEGGKRCSVRRDDAADHDQEDGEDDASSWIVESVASNERPAKSERGDRDETEWQ